MFELNIKKIAQFPKMKRDTTQLTKYSFVFLMVSSVQFNLTSHHNNHSVTTHTPFKFNSVRGGGESHGKIWT